MKSVQSPIRLFGLIACVLMLSATSRSSGQSKSEAEVKYWIFFNDKDAGLGKGPAAIEPGFVTERALERRKLRGRPLAGSIDAPVSPAYIGELKTMGIDPIVSSRWMNGVSARLTNDQLAAVRKLSFVRTLETVAVAVDQSTGVTPVVFADYSAPMDLNFGLSGSQAGAINAVEAIEEGYIGTGVRLGFLDTTTDTLHPALKHLADHGRIVAVRDIPTEFGLANQRNKHGLATSSVALGFDEGDLIGACYGAEYLFATTEYAPSETNQEEDFFVEGMEWMERMGADIVNVSLGYSTFDSGQDSYTYEDMNGDTAITTRAADRAAALGVVVVTSAGNESCAAGPQSCWYYVTAPADGDSVITVGASNIPSPGQPFSSVNFSGAGPTYDGRIKPDVSAPGIGIYFASSSGGYSGGGGGTSFSSPLVASAACQILQANPMLNPIDVRTILRATAHQASNPDFKLGWGVVNAGTAVSLAKVSVTSSERDEIPEATPEIALYPNPTSDQALVSFESAPNERIKVALYDVLGREIVSARTDRIGPAVTATFNVRDLPPGMYFVVVSGDGPEQVRSLVVMH